MPGPIETIKRLGQNLLDLVFPVSCLVCGRDGAYLCQECVQTLPRVNRQQCLACQKPSPYGRTHFECRTRNTVDGIISALPYTDSNVKNIIETFKYNFISNLAEPLSLLASKALAEQQLSDYFADYTLIPVPLHEKRLNWRGFNQSQLLAEGIASQLNMKVDNRILRRSRYTKPQTTLSSEERKKNIVGAFTLTSAVPNKKFLIIDDVVTTGSTISEMAKLLKQNHASEVWALTAAKG